MRLARWLLAVPIVFSACDTGGGGASVDLSTADLSALPDLSTPRDVAVAEDLSAPPDLAPAEDLTVAPDLRKASDGGAPFCEGTPVAGTCAQAYFAAVARCFDATGACTKGEVNGVYAVCWATGARFTATSDEAAMTSHATWRHNAAVCMEADAMEVNKDIQFTFSTGNGMLTLRLGTGDVVCPDGGKANIGARFGACAALEELISARGNNCQQGMCP